MTIFAFIGKMLFGAAAKKEETMGIEAIWNNVRRYEGEVFRTKTGVEYRYKVYGNYLLVNHDRRRLITKESLEAALMIQNPTPSRIKSKGIWGPSYVFGIITDKRIRNA